MGVGAVAGYFGVRRMEIANLITLSESIRLGVGRTRNPRANDAANGTWRWRMFEPVRHDASALVILERDERAVLRHLGRAGVMQLTRTPAGPDTAPLSPRNRSD